MRFSAYILFFYLCQPCYAQGNSEDDSSVKDSTRCSMPQCQVVQSARTLSIACYRFQSANKTSVCAPRVDCSDYPSCTHNMACPAQRAMCVIDSCCPSPVCIPMSILRMCSTTDIEPHRDSFPLPHSLKFKHGLKIENDLLFDVANCGAGFSLTEHNTNARKTSSNGVWYSCRIGNVGWSRGSHYWSIRIQDRGPGGHELLVDPDTQHFVDEFGRVRIFHGVNVVYKQPPFLPNMTNFDPQNSLTEFDLDNLHKWGFNVIRLYAAWMGVNPKSPNEVDDTYLSQLSTAVSMMENKGIYALLDCHQDVLSRFFCGEGIPDWVATNLGTETLQRFPFPFPINFTREPDTGYPVLDQCLQNPFSQYYFTEGVINGFKMLYTNTNGTLDAFASFWHTVATYFADRPSILGYELMNEPSFPALTDVLQVGLIDQLYLAPMYKKLHEVIRTVDDKHLIFFEPCVFDLLHTGFTEGPGGKEYNNRQVFSYHNYCLDVTKQGDPKSDLVCDLFDNILIYLRVQEARKKKFGGMMITEFGGNSNSTEGIEELNRVTAIADDFLQSWTYWQFKKYADLTTSVRPATTESFYTDDGELELNKVQALSRSYAQAIAGLPITMSFSPTTNLFELQFIINTDIQQPTVIYLNEDLNYPHGVSIILNPKNSLTWTSPNHNYYEFVASESVKNGTTILIQIFAKNEN
ncbi:unnamed protein product [Rotaria magnacalcarata]|nr:unnamed protein product [Rotaria magnacalcarata]